MSDEAALLKAIIAHPDDDTPRLMYADWLDENTPDKKPSPAAGPSARAEFIRVQCRLAQWPYDDPDYPELLERERDLGTWINTHNPQLAERVPELPDDLDWYGNFDPAEWPQVRRGFPDEAEFMDYDSDEPEKNVTTIADALKEAFANTTIRSLSLEDALGAEIAGLVKRPVVAGLRGLRLGYLDDDETIKAIRAIATSAHLSGLRRLLLEFPVDGEHSQLLAKATGLGSLDTLEVDSAGRDGMKILASGRWFRNLRVLSIWLGGNVAMKSLAELPSMPNLVLLRLNGIGSPSQTSIRKFAASDSFPQLAHLAIDSTERLSPELITLLARGSWPLRHLRIQGIAVRKAGAEALANAPFAETLRVLELDDCEITAGGVAALAASEKLAGLKHLALLNNPVGPSGLTAIASSPYLRGLRSLNLSTAHNAKVPLDARSVQNFLGALEMPDLRHLDLNKLPVGIRGARTIAEGASFANLTLLHLDECGIGEKGAKAIVESATLGNLVTLNLNANGTGKSVSRLGDPKVLPRLAECNLYRNRLPKGAVGRLRKRPGILI